MPQNAPHVAVTVNIAFRPRSGDLILMNARLAKPIPENLAYSRAALTRLDCLLQRGLARQAFSNRIAAIGRMLRRTI
jgi:hypothetical protein